MNFGKRIRGFLKCFVVVVLGCIAIVVAASNGLGATMVVEHVLKWAPHVTRILGRENTIWVCFGICILAALLISVSIHFKDHIEAQRKWFLGGGVLSMLIAALLASYASRLRTTIHHREQPSGPTADVPAIISASSQPPSVVGTPPMNAGTASTDTGSESGARPASSADELGKTEDVAQTSGDMESSQPIDAQEATYSSPATEANEGEDTSESEPIDETEATEAPSTATSQTSTAAEGTSSSSSASTATSSGITTSASATTGAHSTAPMDRSMATASPSIPAK